MRLGALVPCVGLFVATFASAAITPNPPADGKTLTVPSVERDRAPLRLRRARGTTLPTDLDGQVLANLFAADSRSDFDVSISTGNISCEPRTCRMVLNVRLPESTAPARLSFAVASPRGELSEVRHAECLTSLCTVQMVLERGRNVIAVGATDAVTRASGFATTQVQVDVPLTARRKSEWF